MHTVVKCGIKYKLWFRSCISTLLQNLCYYHELRRIRLHTVVTVSYTHLLLFTDTAKNILPVAADELRTVWFSKIKLISETSVLLACPISVLPRYLYY